MDIIFHGSIKSFVHDGLLKERERIHNMFFIKRWFYRKKLKALEYALATFDIEEVNDIGNAERVAQFTRFLDGVQKKHMH